MSQYPHNPLNDLPETEGERRENISTKVIRTGDTHRSILLNTQTECKAAHPPPSRLCAADRSPCFGRRRLSFGDGEPTKHLNRSVITWPGQNPCNSITERTEVHRFWDAGRFRPDYVGHGEDFIKVKFILVWRGTCTLRPINPAESVLSSSRKMSHGCVIRITRQEHHRLNQNPRRKICVPETLVSERIVLRQQRKKVGLFDHQQCLRVRATDAGEDGDSDEEGEGQDESPRKTSRTNKNGKRKAMEGGNKPRGSKRHSSYRQDVTDLEGVFSTLIENEIDWEKEDLKDRVLDGRWGARKGGYSWN